MLLVSYGLTAAEQTGVWSPIGPKTATIFSMARDTYNPGNLLAGTYFGGIYRSTDWGFSWKHIESDFSAQTVLSISFDPSIRDVGYAGTFQNGIYKTTDGGLIWKAVGSGLAGSTIQSIGVDPHNSNRILIATESALMLSLDAGTTWNPYPVNGVNHVRVISFDPLRSGVIYLGTIGSGLYCSEDDGITWSSFNNNFNGQNVITLEFGPKPKSHLYTVTDNGLYKLPRDSNSWQDITYNLPRYTLQHLLPHPAKDGFLLAATEDGVYGIGNDAVDSNWTKWNDYPTRIINADPWGNVYHLALLQGGLKETTNFGTNWFDADNGMQNAFIGALATIPNSNSSTIYAGSDLGIWKFDWGQVGWQLPQRLQEGVFDLQPVPLNSSRLLAGTERSGILKTINGGDNWSPSAKGILPSNIYSLSRSSADSSFVIAGTSSGPYISLNGGDTWMHVNNTMELPVALAVSTDPVRSAIAWVGGIQGKVYRTIDQGKTFFRADTGLPNETILSLVTARWEKTYAITSSGALYATPDDNNWYLWNNGVKEPALSLAYDPQSSWVLYLGTSGGGVYKSSASGLDWQASNTGLTVPYVFSIAVNPSAPKTVYAGTVGQVFKSTDAALSWVSKSAGLPSAGIIGGLVLSPADPNTVYASVRDYGVYRSTDQGETWIQIATSLDSQGNLPIALLSSDSKRVLLGTARHGVYASSDAGVSWSETSIGMTQFVRSLAIDPRDANKAYAATLKSGLFKTVDGGANWDYTGLDGRYLFKILIDPSNSDILYAATHLGVAQSTDGGISWSDLHQPAAFVFDLVSCSQNPSIVYASSSGIVTKSVDAGKHWQETGKGLPEANILAVAVDNSDSFVYAAAERVGIYRSEDSGNSWKKISEGAINGEQVIKLMLSRQSGIFYAGTNGGGVYASLDKGRNWFQMNTGLAGKIVSSIIESRTTSWLLFAATADAGIFRSTDAGLNWQPLNDGLNSLRVNQLGSTANGKLFAATESGVFSIMESSSSWINAGLTSTAVSTLTVDSANNNHVIVGTRNNEVFNSSDGGTSWSIASLSYPQATTSAFAVTSGAILASTLSNGIMISTDGGQSWTGGTKPEMTRPVITALALDQHNPGRLYATAAGLGVIRTDNSGLDWAILNNGISLKKMLALLVHPTQPGLIFVGTTGAGVFQSKDSGLTWEAINSGLFNRNITSLVVDSVNPRILFAGTEGGGVFSYLRP